MNNQPTTLSDSLELNQKLKKRYEQTMNDGYAKLKMRLHTQVSTHNQPIELTDPLKKPENQKWVSEILTTLQSLRSLLMTSHDAHTRSAAMAQLSQLVEASHADLSRPMMNSLHSFLQASHGYVCVAGANALVKLAHRHPKVVHPVVIEVVIKYLFPLLSDRDCSIRQVAAETLGLLFQLGESGGVKGQTIDQILIPMCTRLLSGLLSQPVAETASLLLPILHMVGYETSGAGEKKTDLSKMAKQVLYRLISEAQVGDADGALNLSILMDVIQKQGFDAILDASSESKPFLKRVYQSALQSGHIDALKAGFIAQCMEHGCPVLFDSEGGVTVEGHRYQLDEASQFYVDQWKREETYSIQVSKLASLKPLVMDRQRSVRKTAAVLLGQLAETIDPRAGQTVLELLQTLLEDEKGNIRKTAAVSLGKLAKQAEGPLVNTIAEHALLLLSESNSDIHKIAMQILGLLAKKMDPDLAEVALESLSLYLIDHYFYLYGPIAEQVFWQLLRQADLRVLQTVAGFLLLLLEEGDDLRGLAIESLGQLSKQADTDLEKSVFGFLRSRTIDDFYLHETAKHIVEQLSESADTPVIKEALAALHLLLRDDYYQNGVSHPDMLLCTYEPHQANPVDLEDLESIGFKLNEDEWIGFIPDWTAEPHDPHAHDGLHVEEHTEGNQDKKTKSESDKITVKSLLRSLKDRHHNDVRVDSIKRLGELAITVTDADFKAITHTLLPVLKDHCNRVRIAAAESLGQLLAKRVDRGEEFKTIVSALLPLLKDRNEYTREAAAKIFGRLSLPAGEEMQKVVASLLPLLKDTYNHVRIATTESLGGLATILDTDCVRMMVDALLPLLKSNRHGMQAVVAKNLGLMAKKADAESVHQIVESLLPLLIDRNTAIQEAAAESLEWIATKVHIALKKSAVDSLILTFKKSDWQIQAVIVKILIKVSKKSDMQLLKEIVKALFPFLKNTLGYVRKTTEKSLYAIFNNQPISVLVLLEQEIKNEEAEKILFQVLTNKKQHEDQLARSAFEKLKPHHADPAKKEKKHSSSITEFLLHNLKSQDDDVRATAIKILVWSAVADSELVETNTNLLIPLLEDRSGSIRISAAAGLWQMAEKADSGTVEKILTVLLPLIKDDNWVVRAAVLWGLNRMAQADTSLVGTIVNALLLLLENEDSDIRIDIIKSVGQLAQWDTQVHKKTIRALFPCLKDKAWVERYGEQVCISAARSLGWLAATAEDTRLVNKIVITLLPWLESRDRNTRKVAAESLGYAAEQADISLVHQMGQDLVPLLEDRDSSVRHAVAESVGYLVVNTDAELKKVIANALLSCLKQESDARVRYRVLESLGYAVDNTDAEWIETIGYAFVPLLKDGDQAIRRIAAENLGYIAQKLDTQLVKKIVIGLVALLKDRDSGVRYCSVKSLGYLVTKVDAWLFEKIVDALLPLLKDSDRDVRYRTVGSFESITTIAETACIKKIVISLLPLLNSKDDRTQAITQACLQNILSNQPISTLKELQKEPHISKHRVAMDILTQVRTRQLSESSTPALPEHDLRNTDTETYTLHYAFITYDDPQLNWMASPMVSNLLLDAYELGGEAFHNHLLEALYLPAQAVTVLDEIHQLGTQGMLLKQWGELQDQMRHGDRISLTYTALAIVKESQVQPSAPAASKPSSLKFYDLSWAYKKIYYAKDLQRFSLILQQYQIDQSLEVLKDPVAFKQSILFRLHPDKGGDAEAFVFAKHLQEKISTHRAIREDIKTALDQFIHGLQSILYKTNVGLKLADTSVDVVRWIDRPTLSHTQQVVWDGTQVYSMLKGGHLAFWAASASAAYQCYQGEVSQAVQHMVTTVAYTALPVLATYSGVSYLGVGMSVGFSAYAASHFAWNAYSLYQEQTHENHPLESAMAYRDLFKMMADSPLGWVYDFASMVKRDDLEIETLKKRETQEDTASHPDKHIDEMGYYLSKFNHLTAEFYVSKEQAMKQILDVRKAPDPGRIEETLTQLAMGGAIEEYEAQKTECAREYMRISRIAPHGVGSIERVVQGSEVYQNLTSYPGHDTCLEGAEQALLLDTLGDPVILNNACSFWE